MRAALLLVGAVPGLLAAQQPACGDRAWPSIGVAVFHCPGGTCGFTPPGAAGGPGFRFTVEPWVRALDPDGPASGRLEEGDALVAVNGLLITTPSGGTELARLDVAREAVLTVRRGDRLVEARVRPRATCADPLMLVGNTVLQPSGEGVAGAARNGDPIIDFTVPVRLSPTAVDASLGMTLRCPGCSLTGGEQLRWTVAAWPVVESVDRGGVADEAGLRPGDEVRTVDGRDVRNPSGGSPLFTLPRGDFTIGYARNGRAGSAFMNRRITDQIVMRDETRIVLKGEPRDANRLLAALARWWREMTGSDNQRRRLPGNWMIRGDRWGLSAYGLLFRGDGASLFAVDSVAGRPALRLTAAPVVAEVTARGAAEHAGVVPGDVVTRVAGLSVVDVEGTMRLLSATGLPLDLTLQRDGRERRVTLTPRELR